MKTLFRFFFLVLLSSMLLAPACKHHPIEMGPDEPITITDTNIIGPTIRFDSLAVGQRSRYLGFDGYKACTGDGLNFIYSNDTLVLEIVGQDANGFKVAETLHYVDTVSVWYNQHIDTTYYYYLTVEHDSLHVTLSGAQTSRSRLFSNYKRSDGLYLVPLSDSEVTITGWQTAPFCCSCWRDDFTRNYDLFGRVYPHLNVMTQDKDTNLDHPGYTYVYSARYGIVKYKIYYPWTNSGYGWDLLPD